MHSSELATKNHLTCQYQGLESRPDRCEDKLLTTEQAEQCKSLSILLDIKNPGSITDLERI